MPTFNTFVKQVEINSGGGIRITVYKQTIQDDGAVIDHPHQITIDTTATDEEIEWQIGLNNEHLKQMGYPAINPIELNFPLMMREHAHKHPVVAERRAIEFDNKAKREKAAREQEEERQKEIEKLKKAESEAFEAAVDAAVKKHATASVAQSK